MRALVVVAHVALAFLCSASPLFNEEQVPFDSISVGYHRVVITPQLSAYVKNALQTASIPGLSMGIVRLAEGRHLPAVELAAWGKQTEDADGEDLTPDVSVPRATSLTSDTSMVLAGPLRHSILLEGISYSCCWSIDR